MRSKVNSRKKILLKTGVLILLAALPLLFFAVVFQNNVLETRPENGLLDLTGHSLAQDGFLILNGEWDFYWQKLVAYDDLSRAGLKRDLLVKTPSVWNDYRINGRPLPAFGYGTYVIRIKGLPTGTPVAIRIADAATAYSLFADGLKIASNGVVGASAADTTPQYKPTVVSFTTPKDEFYLLMQVSNFTYARGGMWAPVLLGTNERIAMVTKSIIYKDLFLIGALLIIGLYYLFFYLMRKSDRAHLILSLLCFISIARASIYGDQLIGNLFPSVPFELIVKTDYISLYLYPILFLQFMAKLFPLEFSARHFKIAGGAAAFYAMVMTVVTVFSPVSFFTLFPVLMQLVFILSFLYVFVLMSVAFLRGRRNAVPILAGTMILLACILHDILYQKNIIVETYGDIAVIGVFFFICIQAYILARRFSDALSDSEALNCKLLEEEELKDKIRKTEMAFLQSQINPHFLYNALNAIDAYCGIDADKASRLIGSLSKYLRQSFDFENLESTVSINKELSHTKAYVDIEKARFEDIRIDYEYAYADVFCLPPLTLQPLVENAIRHGICRKRGSGLVRISIAEQRDAYSVSVEDDGVGMDAETASRLLSLERKNGSVGLLNIHNRLRYLYGRGLTIESEPGKGTRVSFYIPKEGRKFEK